MNPAQRKEIDALIILVDGIQKREKQNLIDTPDNIENHGVIRENFRNSIVYLGEAKKCLLSAK